MKPLNYFEQIIKMPNKADKFDLRLRMVKHAVVYGDCDKGGSPFQITQTFKFRKKCELWGIHDGDEHKLASMGLYPSKVSTCEQLAFLSYYCGTPE